MNFNVYSSCFIFGLGQIHTCMAYVRQSAAPVIEFASAQNHAKPCWLIASTPKQ